MKAVLQLALDFVDLDRALKAAFECQNSVDWIEAGTPLIKSEGMNSVRQLRQKFPKHVIVADLKTMDAGRVEVEMAAKAGAKVVEVCGAAGDETIIECVHAGRNYGVKILVDLIGIREGEIARRAKEVENLGADYIGVHTAIDEQMKVKQPFGKLRKVAGAVEVPVAAAGGLNSETIEDALNAGASILIVGGAITKAENAGKAAESMRRAMVSKKRIKTEYFKRTTDVEEIFRKVSTANISDAMHRTGDIRKVKHVSGKKMVGRATTVRTMPGDWAKPVEAIDTTEKGGVIVVDAGGVGPAVWGELATESALQKKLSGVVVWGAVRDVGEIKKTNFCVYSRRVTPTAGEPRGLGELNVNLDMNGTGVKPGDWIVGDEDGVVVVPNESSIEIANRAMDVLERENRIRKEIKEGSTLSKVTHLLKWEKK
ncbi:MAG: 3-hexulose-6-phosphate synthase [Candidatus Altiarchaeota archaeon]